MPKPLGAEGSELPRRTDEGRPGQLELPVVPAGRAQNVTQRIRDGGQKQELQATRSRPANGKIKRTDGRRAAPAWGRGKG